MAFIITDDCISCEICIPECPNEAITMGKRFCEVDYNRCTECVGHYDEPQCAAVCPMECCKPDPAHPETRDQLMMKFERLQSGN